MRKLFSSGVRLLSAVDVAMRCNHLKQKCVHLFGDNIACERPLIEVAATGASRSKMT